MLFQQMLLPAQVSWRLSGLSRKLSSSSTVERGEPGRSAAGGAGGLPRLRWPSGLREVVKTVGLSPFGGLGPSRSRLGFLAVASRRRRWRRCL
jgi:hypothetical protein